MPILFDEKQKLFLLNTKNTTYAFAVAERGFLTHLHYGPKIADCDVAAMRRPFCKSFSPTLDNIDSRDTALAECACFGSGDFRTPSILVRQSDGHAVLKLTYKNHFIRKGKVKIPGLPASFAPEADVETLEMILVDEKCRLECVLLYSVFADSDVIARSAIVRNRGGEALRIEKLASCLLDVGWEIEKFDLVSFPGSWARERRFRRTPLSDGVHTLASACGITSHRMNPAFCVCSREATEEHGRVYGMALLYSGDFASEIELDPFGSIRMTTGINPACFAWELQSGEEFHAPEALMIVTDGGFGDMSRSMHDFIRAHVMRSPWKSRPRPVLVNNWEATYFDFNGEKLLALAKSASELGVEMLVLDDGWFGKRDNDRCALGDWVENTRKLQGGLSLLSKELQKLGMKLGLWFEPEMISEDSDLFRAHPDWCLQIPGREKLMGRRQFVLDMGREEVVEHLFERMRAILDAAEIAYVKWDCNRYLTEVGSAVLPPERQMEASHRFVLGTYRLHELLLERYPELLIEGCAGGGGRFDAGMLHYVPQIWCSDDTDALERLSIQYGTSFFHPCSSMGAHVSACPNHQTGRTISFSTRGIVALAGTFGYELDMTKLSEAERTEAREQIALYRKVHPIVLEGDLYRLTSPECDPIVAWQNVSKDRKSFVVSWVIPHCTPQQTALRIRLRGLDPERVYADWKTGERFRGDFLMNFGLIHELRDRAGDGAGVIRVFDSAE